MRACSNLSEWNISEATEVVLQVPGAAQRAGGHGRRAPALETEEGALDTLKQLDAQALLVSWERLDTRENDFNGDFNERLYTQK